MKTVLSYPVKDAVTSWVIPEIYRENEALTTLGALQATLSELTHPQITIDFSHVTWADPLPLLILALVLARADIPPGDCRIDLGAFSSGTTEHRTFLKFLANQGFLDCLAKNAAIICDDIAQVSIHELKERLSAIPNQLKYENADCIHAQILDLTHFGTSDTRFYDLIEALMSQATERAINTAFGGTPRVRDVLFQKLRKILYELLLNIAEHAYREDKNVFAAVYARVRASRPPVERQAHHWNELLEKDKATYGQSQFEPNPNADWLEIFICDLGCGLTSRITDWDLPRDRAELKRAITNALRSRYPLESLAPMLFREPLSRVARHDSERSSVTGLQDLGHVLSLGGDYGRLFSDFGTWLGGKFPWNPAIHGSRKNLNRLRDQANIFPPSGTAYILSIQPPHRQIEFEQSIWVRADPHTRLKIIAQMTESAIASPAVPTTFIDLRQQPQATPANILWDIDNETRVLVVRPPRLMSKQDVAQWLHFAAGNIGSPATRNLEQLVLGELTPFQALVLYEFFLRVQVHIDSVLSVLLVSEGWLAACLSTKKGSLRFAADVTGPLCFFNLDDDTHCFNAADLALVLRQADSELFWSAVEEQALFCDAPVDWAVDTEGTHIYLDRYLDLVQALSVPECYRTSKRALRRIFELMPNLEPLSADDLVSTVVREAKRTAYGCCSTEAPTDPKHHLLVGSVSVTMDLVGRFLTRKDIDIERAVHLLVHREHTAQLQNTGLSALLWASQLPDAETMESKNRAVSPWKRIPKTPFIAQHGEKSISILRYRVGTDGALDFQSSYCAQTPAEMYRDFHRFKLMRIGHWQQGARHDLLTLNLRQAYEFSYLEQGRLRSWMLSKFKSFFASTNCAEYLPATFLVYPSHFTTDSIIARIKEDPGFSDVKPKGGMIPIKFTGVHTVSPFLFSSTVTRHIEESVTKLEERLWSVVIFDDGAVSGKHLRELKQYLVTIGAVRVYTLVIVDRTGSPAHEGVLEADSRQNPRYWRWDVPGLGYARECVLCKALAIAQTYVNRLSSRSQSDRLRAIIEHWSLRSVEADWHTSSNRPVPFVEPQTITFGVTYGNEGVVLEKKLALNDSTSLSSVAIELGRLTTRTDVAMSKALVIEQSYPEAAIEMVLSQLLLFIDELDYWEKLERYKYLIKLAWNHWPESPISGLAAIAYTLVDHDLIPEVWEFVHREILVRSVATSLDALIAVNILASRRHFAVRQMYEISSHAGAIEAKNFVLLGEGNIRESLGGLLSIVRNPSATMPVSAHSCPLRTRLSRLREGKFEDLAAFKEMCAAVLQDCRHLSSVIAGMVRERVLLSDANREDLCIELSRIEQEARLVLTGPTPNGGDRLLTSHAHALSAILFGTDQRTGLLGLVLQELFKKVRDGDLIRQFIDDILIDVMFGWAETVQSKRDVPGVRNWTDKPKVRCGHTGVWRGAHFVYWDESVRTAIRDVVNNVIHASREIQNPWGPGTTMADLWWNIARPSNDILVLVFENSSTSTSFTLKHGFGSAGLERAGGRVEGPLFVGNDRVQFKVHLPMHSHFLRSVTQ